MLTAPQFSPARSQSVRAGSPLRPGVAGRDPADVRLLAVSKQQAVEAIRAARGAGQREFGENYAAGGLPKIVALERPARSPGISSVSCRQQDARGREHFDWVHTVDRERIAAR